MRSRVRREYLMLQQVNQIHGNTTMENTALLGFRNQIDEVRARGDVAPVPKIIE